jgi:hypothetical protein
MCYTLVLCSGKGVGSSETQLAETKVVKCVLYNTLCEGWMHCALMDMESKLCVLSERLTEFS